MIECIEGTYSTTAPETGTFNIILSRALGRWTGIPKKTGDSTPGDQEDGTINNNDLIDPQSNNRVIGTLNIDAFNGSFVDGNDRTVTLTGKRTL